jgi:hypothetical protein
MRTYWLRGAAWRRLVLGLGLVMAAATTFSPAADKPAGAPLELSATETEQPIPLAYLDPDGKTARATMVKLHWAPNPNAGPNDEAASFTLDLPADNPATSVFLTQLWNASLASALAWQQPWQGANWKILQTPATDGTGIDAALAVGMLATSARRAYPDKTAVVASLNPDGSLGPVTRLTDRLNALAAAGVTRVVISSLQRFDTDASGQVIDVVQYGAAHKLECLPIDDLVTATETVMNDPLPPLPPASAAPHYSNQVTSYIADYARREQSSLLTYMKFAPKEADLANYPPRLATIWHSVYTDLNDGQAAYRAGQVYVAYRLFSRAHAAMNGANMLASSKRANFDVKASLAESDDLLNHLHLRMNPPSIDQGDLASALLVAEMADWAYDINASLEGAQLVTKQTFSQRTDATDAEKDRAREALLFAIEQSKYLLNEADFYTGLAPLVARDNPLPVDENAARLLPQLIPAQLALARTFTDGIRQRANDLRIGLLFDPQLVSYVGVLREVKADWDARQRKRENDAANAAANPPPEPPKAPGTPASTNAAPVAVKLNSNLENSSPAFDPGPTYRPPNTVVATTTQTKKVSDVARCLIWVNHDCEIAILDEKYLRLNGMIDPVTHEWRVKDRARLDALLQTAEVGARQGVGFAEKAEVDLSVLAMIYERASHLRIQTDDASALEALRNYWRCALLGNLSWQLAHSRKALPVDLGTTPPPPAAPGSAATPNSSTTSTSTPPKATPVKPAPATTAAAANQATEQLINGKLPPVAPIAHDPHASPPRALPVVEDTPPAPAPAPAPAPVVAPKTPVIPPGPPPAPIPTPVPTPATVQTPPPPAATPVVDEQNVPVAHVAKAEDYTGGDAPTTNAPPVVHPAPRATPVNSDNADGHGGF